VTTAPERLLEHARPHRPRRLDRRERRVEAIGAGALLAVAVAMALLVPSSRTLSAGTLALYAALYVAACRVRLYVGAGSVLPTQLIFVGMLFALPLGVVPLVVAGSLAASALIDVALHRAHPERIVTATGDGWYAVAPAALLAAAGSPAPTLGHAPLFLAAFVAQSALDVAAATAREWAGRAIRPGLQLRVMASVYAVDALLTPVGLLVAVAAEGHAYAALLAAPLLVLLTIFARDRRERIDQATARLDELELERGRLQGAIRRVGEAFASNLDRRTILGLLVDTALDALRLEHGRACAGGDEVVRGEPFTGWTITRPLGDDGALWLARHDRSFTRAEEELVGYLAGQGAVSLENARLHEELYRQATIDELTGLSNHRRMQQALDEELARTRRFPAPLSLLILDIDDFKAVNDTHGHLQGDLVLREVARAVREHCREVDEPARYGGEELAVVLRGTRLDGAYRAAETIRRAIEALRVPLPGGGELSVTASVGVAELVRDEVGKNALIAAADTALYQAKRSGKNRTVKARLVPAPGAGAVRAGGEDAPPVREP
jgi:diguanylate cyclase (GGDEF)-like protein